MLNDIKDKFEIVTEYMDNYPDISARKVAEKILLFDTRWSLKTLMNTIYMIKADPSLATPEGEELIDANVKLARERQRHMDSNRIERKAFRDHARHINELEDLIKDYTLLIKKHSFKNITKKHKTNVTKFPPPTTGICQVSDYHLNELIDTGDNKYDFDIAAKRAKLYITEVIKYFKIAGVTRVVFTMLGDMLNSNRRNSELVAMATSRADAMFVGVELLSQMILELAEEFEVSVVTVLGNESRIEQDIMFDFELGRENFDIIIHNTLNLLLKDQTNITFINGNIFEQVVEVEGHNILLIHGHQKMNSEASVQKLIGKFATMGISIQHVLFGHVHATYVAPFFSRNGSLSGGNSYSSQNLQLPSRAAQNLHIVTKAGINTMKIDLQEVKGVTGYNITNVSNKHNVKAVSDVYINNDKIIKL